MPNNQSLRILRGSTFVKNGDTYTRTGVSDTVLLDGQLFYDRYDNTLRVGQGRIGDLRPINPPRANTTSFGGIKLGFTNSDLKRKVDLDGDGKAFVNVTEIGKTYTLSPSSGADPYVNLWESWLGESGLSSGGKFRLKSGSGISVEGDSAGTITITNTGVISDTTYSAGNGLTASGTTFNVGAGNGITVSSNDVSIKLTANSGLGASSNGLYLAAATSNTLGGIRTGATSSAYNYPLSLDSNNKAYTKIENNVIRGSDSYGGEIMLTGVTKSSGTAQTTLYGRSSVYITASGTEGGAQIVANSFNASSDIRLKENIKKYTNTNSLLDLPIYEFDFKETKVHSIGLIAQELRKVFPELVSENEDGYLTIKESKLVYVLIKECKQLKDEVKRLKEDSLGYLVKI